MAEYKNISYKQGEYILNEGDRPHCAYIIKTGKVKVFKKKADSTEVILSTLKPGDIFGEMSMIDAEPRSASVLAMEDVTLIVIDQATFGQKIEALDSFSRNLVQTLVARLRKLNSQLVDHLDPSEMKKAAEKGQLVTKKTEHTNVLIKEDYREKINFGAIKMLMGDINPQSRQGIKGGLHLQGFREIDDSSNIIDLRSKISADNYDLLMFDCAMGVEAVAELIYDVRNSKTACSPFAIIFAIIETPDPTTLEKLSGAGLDDVLVKPVALGNIIDRVEKRIKARKNFVVTLEYVGPDRRSGNRPGTEKIPQVEIPNPLAYKAAQLIDQATYQKQSLSALKRIEGLKEERHVVQIDWLRAKLENLVAEGQDPTYFIERMVAVSKSLVAMLRKKDEEDEHISCCKSILAMIDDFQAGMAEMGGQDWEKFTGLTRKLRTALGPQE